MASKTSENWMHSLPGQFRQERLKTMMMGFYEVEEFADLNSLPDCCTGSVCVVKKPFPVAYMRGTFDWVKQTNTTEQPREAT